MPPVHTALSTTRLALTLVATAASTPTGLVGQTAAGPDLEYGPYAVGFTVIEALDSTRAFRPLRDYRGRLARETARPVQVSIWYPADADPGAPRMRAGDFRVLRETEVDFDAVITSADTRRLRSEFMDAAAGFGAEGAAAARVWDDPTPAVRDASPVPGPHPTVLYFTAMGVSNPLLGAYLASHGFVVASFPSNGRMTEVSLEFTPNRLTMATDVDDAGFVHALLRRLPYADTRRLAVASFSGGSLAALLWVMRDMQASAIVAIEGWERYRRGADIIMESEQYDPRRVRVPFFMLERAADEASPRYAKVPDVVGAMPYADITRVSFRDAAHGDFLSHVSFGHSPQQPEIYAASARMVRRFLRAHLGGDDVSTDRPASLMPPEDASFTMSRHPAVGPVPTEEELYRLAETDPAALVEAYEAAAEVVAPSELFREHVLARAAMFAGDPEARVVIRRVVADAYPASTDARFALGEALAAAGLDEDARAAFRTALELVDADTALSDAEREEWRERIRTALNEAG